MTIASTVSSLEYTGDGVTATFNVTFHFFVAADLAVYVRNAAGTSVSLKTLTTHYTVTGTDTTSGSITFTGGNIPASGEKIVIARQPAIKQETDYPATGKFPSEAHEDALDRLTEIAQHLSAQIGRAVRLTDGAEAQEMRIPAGSASKFLALDADGGLTLYDSSGSNWHAVAGSGAPSASIGVDGDIAINSDGAIYTKASGTWSATGVTISPPLTGDLAALEALSGTGIARRTGTNTWSVGTLISTAEHADNAVTYAKLQDVSATSRVLGRKTSGAGDAEELTASEVLDFLGSTRGQVLYRGASGWAVLSPGTTGHVLQSGGAGADPSWGAVGGTGTVTSVDLSMPSEFSVSGNPVTTSGTLAVTKANQSANQVYAGPSSGGAAAPAFRALAAADLPAASDSAAGAIEIATAAEVKTGSSTTLAVVPGRQGQHSSAIKTWLLLSANQTSILDSLNVSSVTDTGTGDCTVNMTTAFSSTNYAPQSHASYIQTNGGTTFVFTMWSNTSASALRLISAYAGNATNVTYFDAIKSLAITGALS